MISAHRIDMEFLRKASNGDPHSPTSLNCIDLSGQLNAYQQDTLEVGEVQGVDALPDFPCLKPPPKLLRIKFEVVKVVPELSSPSENIVKARVRPKYPSAFS
ncbi:uncharacterized protein LOC113301663 [Papaver somniferum]|nr:uncharacterized protein LOC113301663 [Papaver somniferum]